MEKDDVGLKKWFTMSKMLLNPKIERLEASEILWYTKSNALVQMDI